MLKIKKIMWKDCYFFSCFQQFASPAHSRRDSNSLGNFIWNRVLWKLFRYLCFLAYLNKCCKFSWISNCHKQDFFQTIENWKNFSIAWKFSVNQKFFGMHVVDSTVGLIVGSTAKCISWTNFRVHLAQQLVILLGQLREH